MSGAVVPAAGTLFEQDDQETLDLLLLLPSTEASNDDNKDEIASRLRTTASLFCEDFKVNEVFWNDTIIKSAKNVGFQVDIISSPPFSNHTDSNTTSTAVPAAFETDSGKLHIQAASSLLRISKMRAVQLTLCALKSLDHTNNAAVHLALPEHEETTTTTTTASHLQSLLKTRELLLTVREYYFQQRMARLQIMTECLRMEQDEDSPFHQETKHVMDTLDDAYTLHGRRKRGLFQYFVNIACAPHMPPTRDELLPTLKLYSKERTLSDELFVTDCFQAFQTQTGQERVQAMEALLVLLYHRIDAGIHRIDFAIILLAFEACGTFFTQFCIQRLPYLAGLVLAECTNLCTTTTTTLSEKMDGATTPQWMTQHSLLEGVVSCQGRAVQELQTLVVLLNKFVNRIPERKLRNMAIRSTTHEHALTDAPESIALYSFALLLRLVDIANMPPRQDATSNFDFETLARQCAQTAVDDGGVFDYLHATMEALVTTPVRDSFSSESNVSYDWQFSNKDSVLLQPSDEQEDEEEEEVNAANVAYSSIGLEVLSATIVAFQSTIRTENNISLENVSMLCNLAATIYGNHPLLCKAFWENLEVYTSEQTSRQDGCLTFSQALCYLVDAAHACAASALNAAALASMEDHPGLEEDMLPSLVPLLQLMSSLCSSSGMVESVLKLLPKGMIRIALLCCAPMSSVKDVTTFSKNALQIVQAVQDLARVGQSSNCRSLLRNALEEEGTDVLDGPRVLYRIIAAQPSTDTVSSTLRIIGYFVESATGHEVWVAKAAKYLGPAGLGENGLSALLTGQSSSVALSALHVLNGLVGNLAAIAFCESCETIDILDALYVVMKGVTSSCMLLTTLVSSNLQNIELNDGTAFLIAHGVLRCSAILFRNLRPISFMHKSLRVKAAAQQLGVNHIQKLSTSTPVGQAIAYFASAPVSLSLAIVMEEMLKSANVMQIASDEYARETEPLDLGAWRNITDASREMKPAVETAKVREAGRNIVSNIHELGIDLQGFRSRGWTDDATAMEPILAASAALDLLRLWLVAVDDAAAEEQDGASDFQEMSPCRLIFSQLVRPPIVEGTRSLSQVWPTDRLTLCDVLIRYLDGAGEDLSSLLAADVLSLALVPSKRFHQSLQVHFADNVVRCAPGLSLVLKQAIADIDAVASAPGEKEELSFDQDLQIRKGLASLRLLSLCLESESRIVDAICGSQSSPLDSVVEILNSTSSVIRGGFSFEQLASDPVRKGQFRAASSSIHVLLSLWKSSATTHASQNTLDVVAEIKRKIIGDLVTIVKFAGRVLSTANASTESSLIHVVAVLTAAASDALEVLTIEMSRELNESQDSDKSAKQAASDLKTGFPFLSDTFGKVDAALSMAQSWSKLDSNIKSVKHVSIDDPRSLLCSFPATYLSHLESHHPQDNLCDIGAALTWGLPIFATQEISKEILQRNNACYVLLSKQSSLVKSWGQMAIMSSIVHERDRELAADELISMTQAVLASLARIAIVIEEAQMLIPQNFLPLDVGMIADMLAGLLVETSSRLSTVVSLSQSTILSLVGMLGELNRTQEKLLSSTRINRSNHHVISLVFPSYLVRESDKIRDKTTLSCCALQKRLMSAAISFFTTMDRASPLRLSPTEGNQQVEVALKFVEMACKGLELAGSLLTYGHDDNTSSCLSRELLETSVSLLTVLLSRERGPGTALTDESQFYANAAALMKRSNVTHRLVLNAVAASKLAVDGSSKERALMEQFRAEEKQVELVQSIFNFVRMVTKIGKKSDGILSLLSCTDIFKMIVENPLLIAANEDWVSNRNTNNPLSTALRGYLPLNGKMPVDVEGDSRTIVTGTFLSGRDDPVHVLWRTALNIVESIVHAYSRQRDTLDSTSRHFLETAIAFLRTYYTSLISCLDQCSKLSTDSQHISGASSAAHTSHTLLTFNTLCETADILALVSALCSNAHLQMFENACYDIYHGMIRACHTVLDGLGEFLSATGTAKEIFAAMKDYDIQLQQENANRDGFAFSEPQVEPNPLLSAGIPNAKHEAIKHAHYANRCCALVTPEDYRGLPTASSSSVESPFSTSSLERDSQLSLNSPFMLRMEYAAAGCVSIAIAVLSETHPASSCFVTFSPEEMRHRDMLPLLREGTVISALSEAEMNDGCRFYRILRVDTVRRKCLVRHLDRSSDQAEERIDVDRVNGIEDTSKRIPVLDFSAAPTSFAELESAVALLENTASTGDIISILRWCYQCISDTDSDRMKSIRKVLAESASTLVCTEISLHKLQGTFSMAKRDELSKRVMSQLLQLFDDSNEAPRWSGQLKQTMSPFVWNAAQQQLEEELRIARSDRRERNEKQLKRAAAVNGHSPWFGINRRESVGIAQPMSEVNFAASR